MATAVVMAVTAVPVLMSGEAFAETSPVSESFAMGGGVSGDVDPRTGRFKTSFQLAGVRGRGGLDVSLSLTYDQQSAAAEQNKGAGRAGLGAGWSYSLPAVAVEGGLRVIPASGGSYEADAGEVTGMARYPLEDLKFEEKQGTLPARDGIEGERAYSYLLRYDDGRTDYFDANGDLSVRTDRFGNRIDFGWEVPPDGQTHRLAWAVDSYGQKTVLESAPDGSVTVISPKRSDGKAPEMKLALTEGQLTSITDTAGQRTTFHYENPDQPALLTRAGSPTGAQTVVAYKPVDYMPGLTVVDSVKVTDDNGENTLSERRFSMDVEGGDRRNYTGFPAYHDRGGNALFDADDNDAENYTYITELSDGRSTVRSTYNKLHLLTKRETKLKAGQSSQDSSGGVTVQTQELHYEGEKDGTPPRPDNLPANYSKPTEATVTFTDPATGAKRTTRETAKFDTHGRQTEKTDTTGATTTTVYDDKRYGLPVKTTVNGTDDAVRITENVYDDKGSLRETRTSASGTGKDGEPTGATARTVTAFTSDEHGETTSKTVQWAPGARPEGDTGPEKFTESFERAVSPADGTLTVTATTPEGMSRQVEELATGRAISVTGSDGRTTTTEYDGAGRQVKQTAPGDLVTTTEYPTPNSVKVTGPDGHTSVETTDLLGRPVKTTDNVRNGEIVKDEPAARTLRTIAYEDNGQTAKITDGAGRVTVTTNDALGRPAKTVTPSGMIQLTSYNDAATTSTSTKTTAILPAGETDPAKAVSASTETYDQAGRAVRSESVFADKTPVPPTTRAFDGLGRLKQGASNDVSITPVYDAKGGSAQRTVIAPQNPEEYPGSSITADTRNDLAGAPAVKTLTPGGEEGKGRAGSTTERDAAGRVAAETDQNGGRTAYVYASDGHLRESVSPTGVKTSFEYEKDTGRTKRVTVTGSDGKTAEKTEYTYDPATGRVTEVFDPDRKQETLLTWSFNADGKVTRLTYPDGKTVSQTFDNYGQLLSATDITGAVTAYRYNNGEDGTRNDGTLREAVQHDKDPAEHDDARELARVAYTYDGLSRLDKLVRGSGSDQVTTAYTYTGADKIKSEKTTRADGSVVTEAAYRYDSHGNLAHRTDTRPETTPVQGQVPAAAQAQEDAGGAGASAADNGKPVTTSTDYTYDSFNRLTGSVVTDGGGNKLTGTAYTVNVSGDVTRTEVTDYTQGGKKTVTEHEIDPAGRLTAVTVDGTRHNQEWDAEGNLRRDWRGTAYTYSPHNQPTSSTTADGITASYTYWANGTRRATTAGKDGEAGQAVTGFYYNPSGDITNDTHSTPGGSGSNAADSPPGTVTASYLHAVHREARTLSGAGADASQSTGGGYLLFDRHGNTTALATASGHVNAAWHYTDYGQHTSHTGIAAPAAASVPGALPGAAANPFTYAGEYTNSENGTQYLRSRLYDPAQNRFTQKDPAELHNRFQAFDANPVNMVDPSGNTSVWDVAMTGAVAFLGLVLGFAALAATVFMPNPATSAIAVAAFGLALDAVSGVLEVAAALDNRSWDDGVNIAAYALSGAGLLLGLGGAFQGIFRTGKTVAKLDKQVATALNAERIAAEKRHELTVTLSNMNTPNHKLRSWNRMPNLLTGDQRKAATYLTEPETPWVSVQGLAGRTDQVIDTRFPVVTFDAANPDHLNIVDGIRMQIAAENMAQGDALRPVARSTAASFTQSGIRATAEGAGVRSFKGQFSPFNLVTQKGTVLSNAKGSTPAQKSKYTLWDRLLMKNDDGVKATNPHVKDASEVFTGGELDDLRGLLNSVVKSDS